MQGKKRILNIRAWYTFASCLFEKRRLHEAKRLPRLKYISNTLKGFFPNKPLMYEFNKYRHSDYINDQQMLKTLCINEEHEIILKDKLLFEYCMGKFVKVPKIYALIKNNSIVPIDSNTISIYSIQDLVNQKEKIVIKPVDGLGGKGVNILQLDKNSYLLNGQEWEWDDIAKRIMNSDGIIICEHIQQNLFASSLYPHTLNTIRMLSIHDVESGEPHIAAAALRVGCSRSYPVDNLSSGGIVCDIDPAKGTLGRAATGFLGHGHFQWVQSHPDTEVRFEGLHLEGWDDICDTITSVAHKFPQLPYIAWDVALGEDGIVVIEGNSWTDVSLFQIFRPLLLNQKVASFFRYHHIV